jgi:hypothetical protein
VCTASERYVLYNSAVLCARLAFAVGVQYSTVTTHKPIQYCMIPVHRTVQ